MMSGDKSSTGLLVIFSTAKKKEKIHLEYM